jgi:hypothetical protein
MSATTPEILLTPIQADNVLKFAISAAMYEVGASGLEGVPPDERMRDAATLVFQAKRARANGNTSEKVSQCLLLAEVDTQPTSGAQAAVVAQPPAVEQPQAVQAVVAPAPEVNGAADDSLAGSDPGQLAEALKVLQGYPSSPTIEAEIQRIQAELIRRQSEAQPAPQQPQQVQEVAPPAPPPAAAAPPGPDVPDAGGLGPAAGDQPTLPPVPGHEGPRVLGPVGGAEGRAGSTPADAVGLSGGQAPQPGQEGGLPPGQAPAQDGGRADLEAQLTFQMIQAYGLTVESVKTLTDEQLRSVIASPGGPQLTTTQSAPPASTTPAVSSERESLEERVTGPLLKVYKRGRVDIPDIGDNELRLMVENPTGASAEQITEARVKDGAATSSSGEQSEPAVSTPPAQAQAPEQPAAVSSPPSPALPSVQPAMVTKEVLGPEQVSSFLPQPAQPSAATGREAAMAIIAREHLPIPIDVAEAPTFPNDISKVSDTELFSMHARMHACESRANWLINEQEDAVKRLEKLLRVARLNARKALQPLGEGKRRTKDETEAAIESSPEVQQLLAELEGAQDTVGTLRVLRENYKSDVSTCSRQFSMRSGEERGIPAKGGA